MKYNGNLNFVFEHEFFNSIIDFINLYIKDNYSIEYSLSEDKDSSILSVMNEKTGNLVDIVLVDIEEGDYRYASSSHKDIHGISYNNETPCNIYVEYITVLFDNENDPKETRHRDKFVASYLSDNSGKSTWEGKFFLELFKRAIKYFKQDERKMLARKTENRLFPGMFCVKYT